MNIEDVTKFIIEKHSGQFRKTKNITFLPYFYHPVQVSQLIWKWGAGTVDTMFASLAHDLLEDTKTTHEELVEVIGKNPADIVLELSYFPNEEQTKDDYLNSFDKKSIIALIIKLADRFCNVVDFKLSDPKYAIKYFEKARILYDLLVDRRSEIEEAFGVDVWNNIWLTQSTVNLIISKDEYVVVPN